jgi:hypothetical protein
MVGNDRIEGTKKEKEKTPCVLYKDPEFQRTPEDLPIHAQDIDR